MKNSRVTLQSLRTLQMPHHEHCEQKVGGSQDNQPENADDSDKKRQNREILFHNLARTPLLPEEVYADLPEILAESSPLFSFRREKDLYLLGAITVLSGMFPTVTGIYDQKVVHSNLYLFVVAPPANGKGTLIYCQHLGKALHQRYSDEYKAELLQYKTELRNNSMRNRQRVGALSDSFPVKPARKVLFIPANISSAAIMGHLQNSGGVGIIFETEADTLAVSLKQDWGNYSDLLRKSFQHENLSMSRKTNDEFIEIFYPRISVVLSGTLSQVKGIFPSAENGLVSRFMFYAFKATRKWKNVSPENNFNMTVTFNQFAVKTLEAYDYLSGLDTSFTLSHDQWKSLNSYFTSLLPYYQNIEGDAAESVIKRFGLILYRIAMVLSSLRKFDNRDTSNEIICSDVDFTSALMIS